MLFDEEIIITFQRVEEPQAIEVDRISDFSPNGNMWHYEPPPTNLIFIQKVESKELRNKLIGNATEDFYIHLGRQRGEVRRFLKQGGIELKYR
ncbi:MAG: hypothetical protein ABIH92_01010 [Nanoarchaeota archaeon]